MGVSIKKHLYYLFILILCLLIFVQLTEPIYEGFQDAPTISFISYGNDVYKTARDRIQEEAKQFGVFNGAIQVYTPGDLSDEFKSAAGEVLNGSRGGGYWIWKPYIIYDAMKKLNMNDILVYADAGCSFQKSGMERFQEYLGMISPESGKSIFAMRLSGFPEEQWTTSAIFDHLQVPPGSDTRKSAQVVATVLMFRKTEESIALVSRWLTIAIEQPHLFSDQHNEDPANSPIFRDNRHDQSIFSVLIKSEPYNQAATIIEDEIDTLVSPQLGNVPILAMRNKN